MVDSMHERHHYVLDVLYECDFDPASDGTCSFTNGVPLVDGTPASINWTLTNRRTPSHNTGPSEDATGDGSFVQSFQISS